MVDEKRAIKSISFRRVLNSHVEFTNEFIVELVDGSVGLGAAPQGETISIYEDKRTIDGAGIIEKINTDGVVGRELTQAELDGYLDGKIPEFGRNNAYALSLAFFNAANTADTYRAFFGCGEERLEPPALCMNILNGGWHAYTNPVLSDFHEYILVAKNNNIEEMIADHARVQSEVRKRLKDKEKVYVSGNPVNRFETEDNREVIEFLLGVVSDLGIENKYDMWIDASGGDLYRDGVYTLEITDKKARSRDEFLKYWLDIIEQFHLGFLEDPFQEQDYDNWREVTSNGMGCRIIGDNFYSSDAARIEEGAAKKHSHGVLLKPNQAGTVTAIIDAVRSAQKNDQIAVTSHRSISTESTFLSLLTCMMGVKYIKIGPLYTDYSSVVRLNEIIRLTEE
ncbi:MAG: hypothetical protein B6D63_05680 [Candidatus Latescibacteria bacterium 4484_7]|nr:MAG: hypothetical protein B6D63_05680 [Candidatus Latescibacteria bacterium 4484_7]